MPATDDPKSKRMSEGIEDENPRARISLPIRCVPLISRTIKWMKSGHHQSLSRRLIFQLATELLSLRHESTANDSFQISSLMPVPRSGERWFEWTTSKMAGREWQSAS